MCLLIKMLAIHITYILPQPLSTFVSLKAQCFSLAAYKKLSSGFFTVLVALPTTQQLVGIFLLFGTRQK